MWYSPGMEASAAIERINALLDASGPETSNTSMRIPTALRDAAALAVRELGVASSATALTAAALRATLEAVVMQAALDEHYARHPQARPDLGDLAVAAAEIDGHRWQLSPSACAGRPQRSPGTAPTRVPVTCCCGLRPGLSPRHDQARCPGQRGSPGPPRPTSP